MNKTIEQLAEEKYPLTQWSKIEDQMFMDGHIKLLREAFIAGAQSLQSEDKLADQYIFTRDQLAEYLANYSFHMSGAYNKNNAEKYIEGDWRNYINLEV